jgi:hypothetical protein
MGRELGLAGVRAPGCAGSVAAAMGAS